MMEWAKIGDGNKLNVSIYRDGQELKCRFFHVNSDNVGIVSDLLDLKPEDLKQLGEFFTKVAQKA